MSNEKRSALLVLSGAALWGCIGPFVKYLTAIGLTSMQIVGVRVFLSALLFFLFLLITDRSALKIKLKHLPLFLGTGIVSLAFFNVCYFECIRRSGIAVAVVLLYTSPIFVMLFSALFFREKLTRPKLIALLLTFCGCLLVTGLGTGAAISPTSVLFGLGSGLGYGLYSIFGKFALRHYSSNTVTLYTFLFASLVILPLADMMHADALLTPGGMLAGLGIAVLICILPYLLYTAGLNATEPGRAAVLATIEPVVGCLIGFLFYHEAVLPQKILGIALILFSIVLLNRPQQTTAKDRSKV